MLPKRVYQVFDFLIAWLSHFAVISGTHQDESPENAFSPYWTFPKYKFPTYYNDILQPLALPLITNYIHYPVTDYSIKNNPRFEEETYDGSPQDSDASKNNMSQSSLETWKNPIDISPQLPLSRRQKRATKHKSTHKSIYKGKKVHQISGKHFTPLEQTSTTTLEPEPIDEPHSNDNVVIIVKHNKATEPGSQILPESEIPEIKPEDIIHQNIKSHEYEESKPKPFRPQSVQIISGDGDESTSLNNKGSHETSNKSDGFEKHGPVHFRPQSIQISDGVELPVLNNDSGNVPTNETSPSPSTSANLDIIISSNEHSSSEIKSHSGETLLSTIVGDFYTTTGKPWDHSQRNEENVANLPEGNVIYKGDIMEPVEQETTIAPNSGTELYANGEKYDTGMESSTDETSIIPSKLHIAEVPKRTVPTVLPLYLLTTICKQDPTLPKCRANKATKKPKLSKKTTKRPKGQLSIDRAEYGNNAERLKELIHFKELENKVRMDKIKHPKHHEPFSVPRRSEEENEDDDTYREDESKFIYRHSGIV